MSLKSVLKTLITVSLASVGSADLTRSLPISYGHCYHVVDEQNQYLGHDINAEWRFLQFGPQANGGSFKICPQPGTTCGLNQPDAVVNAGQTFYLFDNNGNFHAPNGNTIVSNDGGFLFAGAGVWNQYVEFTATNERAGAVNPALRVHARDHWPVPHDGLSVNPALQNHLLTDYSHSSAILNFVETDCPPS